MTHVAYLKRIVAGARRMWLKTEAMVPPTSLPWSPGMSDARSCRKRKNQTLLVSKECEMLIIDVITYFRENIQSTYMWLTSTYHQQWRPCRNAWWMEDERQRQRSQSKVKSECYVKAGRPGLNHGLSRHHRAQVEGVEGLMSYVPQVVTRKGGMPAPRTRLQHLVDSKILSKKN